MNEQTHNFWFLFQLNTQQLNFKPDPNTNLAYKFIFTVEDVFLK